MQLQSVDDACSPFLTLREWLWEVGFLDFLTAPMRCLSMRTWVLIPYLWRSCLSEAAKRRSRCGSVRGWRVVSSRLSPGFAPQVGQQTAWSPTYDLNRSACTTEQLAQ